MVFGKNNVHLIDSRRRKCIEKKNPVSVPTTTGDCSVDQEYRIPEKKCAELAMIGCPWEVTQRKKIKSNHNAATKWSWSWIKTNREGKRKSLKSNCSAQ